MSRKRRKFDKEFKKEAARLVIEEGRSIREVANNLGVIETVLGRWVKEYEASPQGAFPGKGRMRLDDEETRALKKKLKDTEEERDILKKALAIFSTKRN